MTETSDLWFKDAVIYQLHVRSFCDSDGDGIGDFRGLSQKLDYIRDLGVTTIWLLPFYPSPLKDDGYDIAEYKAINPSYGTLEDFQNFLDEAHRRGLRVITELVVNHTSDQHEWFQKSRRDKPGGHWRNFYVWEEEDERFSEARIIFQDFETSNWEWDAAAGAYYWHRFYKHQPDLNFDNPAVRKAVQDVLDFWMEKGVDGFRLDAVPYLIERDGTTCENLPETHDCLKELRSHLDVKYPDRMLLAEANQWPEDAAAYFGDGDECHMNFHFPLMPRLYMSLQREDRFPIVDILEQTPNIPDNCQWGLFLRNHDELTLEMVTDEERDYMLRAYAANLRARINLGIRRRLMPLLENSRRKIELLNGLLFSLPGTPIVYYGDEIGMGDNIYLGDRNGVRTPMQWSADRNAGFSRANPQQLFLPPIVDPEYHYTSLNVEAQEDNPQSLLWWMRRLIALRNRHPVFGRGQLEFLKPDNGKVLAYIREDEHESILVVANLSRSAQFVELDLSRFSGWTPVEMSGRMHFPQIGHLPYLLTLGGHSFYWFQLEPLAARPEIVPRSSLPEFQADGDWEDVFTGRHRSRIESVLADFLQRQTWFETRGDTLQSVSVRDVIPVRESSEYSTLCLLLADVGWADRDTETYLLPFNAAAGEQPQADLLDYHSETALMRIMSKNGPERIIYDAAHENEFHLLCTSAMRESREWDGNAGKLIASKTEVFDELVPPAADLPQPRIMEGERGPDSVNLADRFHSRFFRQVDTGISPALDIGRFLTGQSPPPPVPKLAGSVEYAGENGPPLTLAVLHEYIDNEGTARQFAVEECRRYFEEIVAHSPHSSPSQWEQPKSLLRAAREPLVGHDVELIGPFLQAVELMGRRTGELHVALASDDTDPAFFPEKLTSFSQRGLVQSMRSAALRTFDTLQRRHARLPEDIRDHVADVLSHKDHVLAGYEALRRQPLNVKRIRCHGDSDLRHLLHTGKDYVITGFRGDPGRPVSERRIKQSPLSDLAGMLRSLFAVSRIPVEDNTTGLGDRPDDIERLHQWADFWFAKNGASFLLGYIKTPGIEAFVNADDEGQSVLFNAYLTDGFIRELSKALSCDSLNLTTPLNGILYTVGNPPV